MAIDRSAPKAIPSWSRLVEWSLLAGVVVVLGLVFARQVRVVQGQAELAAVKSVLGGLRTALVLDYAHRHSAGGVPVKLKTQRNPFGLLELRPLNYLGEMTAAQMAAEPVPAPGWVFDPVCVCVGYLPLDAQWFDSPSGDFVAWYQVSGAPGPSQLTAKEAYRWQGQRMD